MSEDNEKITMDDIVGEARGVAANSKYVTEVTTVT